MSRGFCRNRRRDGAINRDFNWTKSDCSNSKVKFHEYVTCVYLCIHRIAIVEGNIA